jgi:hypothetical protein
MHGMGIFRFRDGRSIVYMNGKPVQ